MEGPQALEMENPATDNQEVINNQNGAIPSCETGEGTKDNTDTETNCDETYHENAVEFMSDNMSREQPGDDAKTRHNAYLLQLGQRWFTVEPVLIIYNVAAMSLMPILTQYAYRELQLKYNLTANGNTNQSEYEQCLAREEAKHGVTASQQAFQEELASWNTLMLVFAILPMLIVLFPFGSLSDSRGRRWALLPPLVGSAITGVITTLIVAFHLPLSSLVILQLLNGFSGANGVTGMAAFAYIADISTPEQLFRRMVGIEIGMGLGSLLGQLAFGWLIDHTGFVAPAIAFTCLVCLGILYTIFFVPETILKDSTKPKDSCDMIRSLYQFWIKGNQLKGLLQILWLCLMLMLFNALFSMSPMMVMTLYLLDPPICFTPILIGLFNGLTFFLKAVGSIGFMATLSRRVHPCVLQIIGVVSISATHICLGFATNAVLPFVGCVTGIGSMLVNPITRSFASNKVPKDQQGALFSGLMWVEIFSMLAGPPMVNAIYAETPLPSHRYIFVGSAVAMLVPLALVIYIMVNDKKQPTPQETVVDGEIVADMDGLVVN